METAEVEAASRLHEAAGVRPSAPKSVEAPPPLRDQSERTTAPVEPRARAASIKGQQLVQGSSIEGAAPLGEQCEEFSVDELASPAHSPTIK